jgi:mono/diheme cytochrome c family protein
VTSRYCFVFLVGLLALAGCDDAQYAGPIRYREHERAAKDLADKPKLRETINQSLTRVYGDDVQHIKVPEDSSLRENGLYIANLVKTGDKLEQVFEKDPSTGKPVAIAGGYAVYRRNCLHCHGVFGAGDGPTAEFFFPKPRDYRPGIFKFTSTNPVDAKPTRADLRKTILYGLHGTSMPGFEANLSASEIEQVIDYMTFLSMRGETERYLIDEAMTADDKDAESTIEAEFVGAIVAKVTSSWKDAETQVVNPPVKRVEPTRESIQRGRELYLGLNKTGTRVECNTCHGLSGKGNGVAFIEPEIVRDVVTRFHPLDVAVDDFFKAAKFKAASSHEASKPEIKSDPDALAKFLTENPPVLTQLRKNRELMKETPDKEFAEKFQADPKAVAEAARLLLPDLDDPEFRALLVAKMDHWTKSLDVWGNPLRPANLLEGTYKGGRRPLDLYWRIAKGINGAKMPAHAGPLTDDQIWDLVNFVLALPEDPAMLPESLPTPAPAGPKPHSVANSR